MDKSPPDSTQIHTDPHLPGVLMSEERRAQLRLELEQHRLDHLDFDAVIADLRRKLAQTWVPVGNMIISGADNSEIHTGADGAWITVVSDIDEPEYEGTAVLPPDLRLCRRQETHNGQVPTR